MRKEYAVLINEKLQNCHFDIANGYKVDVLGLGMFLMAVRFVATQTDPDDVFEIDKMIDDCRNWVIPKPAHQSVN